MGLRIKQGNNTFSALHRKLLHGKVTQRNKMTKKLGYGMFYSGCFSLFLNEGPGGFDFYLLQLISEPEISTKRTDPFFPNLEKFPASVSYGCRLAIDDTSYCR